MFNEYDFIMEYQVSIKKSDKDNNLVNKYDFEGTVKIINYYKTDAGLFKGRKLKRHNFVCQDLHDLEFIVLVITCDKTLILDSSIYPIIQENNSSNIQKNNYSINTYNEFKINSKLERKIIGWRFDKEQRFTYINGWQKEYECPLFTYFAYEDYFNKFDKITLHKDIFQKGHLTKAAIK